MKDNSMSDESKSRKRLAPQRRDPKTFPPIKREHAEAIGHVTANWSSVEGAIAGIAHTLLGIQGEPAWAVTAEMSADALYNLVHALLWATREQAWVDEWREIAPTFAQLRTTRNNVIHAEWQVVEPSHWAIRVTRKMIVSFEHGEFSTERLLEISEQMFDLIGWLDAFCYNVAIPAGPKIQKIPEKPPLQRGQSQKARAQAQARTEKKAKKQHDRERDTSHQIRTEDAPKD
jgi:hypothetical protein